MHKFKIGDKVKVVDEKAMRAFCVPDYAKRHGTIKELSKPNSETLSVKFEGDIWWYPEDCLDYDRKFDPKPGDTIVCNNGMTFTACKVEDYKYLDYYPNSKITTEIQEPGHNHMCWGNFDGAAESYSYSIKEIIPAPVSAPEPVPAQKTYTVREVLEAYREYNGYSATPSDMSVNGTQKILDRRDDPDYTTYVELKKRFETKEYK